MDYLPSSLRRTRPRSFRRRTDDVRAGQLRTLPAQDLQRAAGRIDGEEHAALAVRHDPQHPCRVAAADALSAYKDNAAVVEGFAGPALPSRSARRTNTARTAAGDSAFCIKVETHNHPTAISPFPGASTGAGGEIRDEGATGRGGKPKAGLTGFSVSHLRIPALPQPWERPRAAQSAHGLGLRNHDRRPARRRRVQQRVRPPQPDRLFPQLRAADRASRPGARLRQADHAGRRPGRDRPRAGEEAVAAAGRCGDRARRPGDADRPRRRRGLLGRSGQSSEALDFASVQRDNPEMERRCQEVIDRCVALGEANPDPLHARRRRRRSVQCDSGTAARFRRGRRDRPGARCQAWTRRCRRCSCGATSRRNAMCSASPPERSGRIRGDLPARALPVCRGRHATAEQRLVVGYGAGSRQPSSRPSTCRWTCCSARRRRCIATRAAPAATRWPQLDTAKIDLREAGLRVLSHPTVAAKNFLVTIGDRTRRRLVLARPDGRPWQLPLADCAISLTDFHRRAPAKRWRSANARRWP